ncbi:MAG: dioxygenase [Phyllobacteriaceae bacterium]|nr:dioxygenase [Phyllobacteriaceae bacterium]
MEPMPTIFVSHGGPNVVTDPSEARAYLEGLSGRLPRPRAIVIASAHFETDGPTVVRDPHPGMIYDFGGFAPELYEMIYPAPGDPALAETVHGLLDQAGLSPAYADKRGYDHGTWTVLRLAWPDADIPVVQVSIDPSRDAAYHHRLGAALAPLRDEGVLMIGSGHITHNLRAVFSAMREGMPSDPEMASKVDDFVGWMAEAIASGDIDALLVWRDRAPFVADNHPTDEHLMPLFFAAGAAGEGARAEHAHASRQFDFFAWDSWIFR